MKLFRVGYIVCVFLLLLLVINTSASITKYAIDRKIENLKTTEPSLLKDSIEVIVYNLYSYDQPYGLSKIKELDSLISDDQVDAKLRIKHSLAAFDEKNKYALLDSALNYANQHNVEEFKVEYNISKGNWYYIDHKYDSALVAILKARDISHKLHINHEIQIYHLLGDLFYSLELYEQAEEYFRITASLLVNPRYDEAWRKRVIKNNLGLIEMKKGNYQDALNIFQYSKSRILPTLPTFRDSLSICYLNRKIGQCLYELNRNYEEAIEQAIFTYNFAKKHRLNEHLYPVYNLLIKLYIKTNNTELFHQFFNEYKTYYKSLQPSIEYKKENALLRAEVAEYLGNEKMALNYYKDFKALDDSEILQVKSASIVKLLTGQDYLNLENNYNQVKHQRKVLELGIFIAIILVSLILIFAYRLFKLNRNLIESNQMKDKLFSIISHDLRAPFNSIVGFSELSYTSVLEKDYKELEQYNLHVLEKSKELLHLIDNLLDWSRTQQSRLTVNLLSIKIVSILEDIKPSIALQAGQKHILIDYQLDKNHLVKADEYTMKTVFTNILSNAIKYSYSNNVIQVISRSVKDMIEISVIDKGIGIPKDKLNNLFHLENQQSAIGTNSEPGTGLGLIICKEFVEKNEGIIDVKSEEGAGTTVRILLPKA